MFATTAQASGVPIAVSASRSSCSRRRPFSCRVACNAAPERQQAVPLAARAGAAALSALAAASLVFSSSPALAAAARLPPIDKDPARCERAFVGNTIGQANAVSDKLLDLRQCMLKGANLSGKVLAGALLVDADLTGANLQEAVLTKAYAVNANLSGSDMTNAVVDRVIFDDANLSGVRFVNAVITGTTFEGADLSGAVFEDALIGSEDAKRLCANPTLTGNSRFEVGCRK